MRFIEYQIVIGDAPPGLIANGLREFTNPDKISEPQEEQKEERKGFWNEGEIHRVSSESLVWTFSLIYRGGNFDIIKWKSSFAWKENKNAAEIKDKYIMKKDLFIGSVAGIFFLAIDENVDDNFNYLADMMDVFIQKSEGQAPFLVYGVIENKEKIQELKTNKELLKSLAEVKKWVTMHKGEFKLENLAEIKMNMIHLINQYSHFILTKFKSKTEYSGLKLGEVHYLDYEDLTGLKEIEASLAEQAGAGETVDDLLSTMLFEMLKKPEFIEEEYIPPPPEAETEVEMTEEIIKASPRILKQILREIRLGIRRQCPKCFNLDRNMIFEEIDREHIIMQNPNIYGFRYRCGKCGNTWKTSKYELEDVEEQ